MKRRTLLSALGSVPLAPYTVERLGTLADRTNDFPIGSHYRSEIVPGTPTTADGFFQVFQDKNDMVWSGGDQVTSFRWNGYFYWLFGDTILSNGENPDGAYPAGSTMVGNKILLQVGDQFSNAMANDSDIAVPNPATHTEVNNERYWTQGMFQNNGFLYVLCQRVINDSTAALGFKLAGTELAKFTQDSATGKLTLVGMVITPGTGQFEVPGPFGIQWASDAVVSGSYVYFYGSTLSQGNAFVDHFGYVARVETSNLETPSAWRFYAKSSNTWKSSIAQLNQDVTNQPDAIIEAQISSVRYINGKFVAIYKPWNGEGSEVKVRTSLQPYGPWNTEVKLFDSPAGTWEGRNYVTYCPQLHPFSVLDSGKTLVSIAWNGQDFFADTLANADLYKPRFYEFTL